MAKDLVIVESPAKARTIGRFLGKNYEAIASMGHVRDLPKREIGVDVDKNFKPKYSVMPDKRKVIAELKKASAVADAVYLATDPDREGEAIAWHLIHAAKIAESKIRRVVFHEITESAIKEAFDNPRGIDEHLIDAQQARRILDRLVGYDLSPVLWKKVRRGLSAGRVQSVALRLIVDRETEINAFVAEEYWSIEASLASPNDSDVMFKAGLHSIKGKSKRIAIPNGNEANKITTDLDPATFSVSTIATKERRSKPTPPFITSSLQQEAFRKLRFNTRRTMTVAQQLYEGIDVGVDGSTGLITYMRTDSTTAATSAVTEARDYIKKKFGPDYLPQSPRVYSKKVKGAQEAHEAIRPTSIHREPESIRTNLTSEQYRLYELIWNRMLASQMADAILDATAIDIDANDTHSGTVYRFRVTGSVTKFPGFRRLYLEDKDDSDNGKEAEVPLPVVKQGDPLQTHGILPEQHFTQPPPRFSEASLVRALEERGIGRPSTYAPTIATVIDRDYARKDKNRLVPTKLGIAVSELLTQHFPDIMDVGFTARVEEELDEIASGEREWTPVLNEFYKPFNESVQRALVEAERVPRDKIDEESDEVCTACERPMVIKSGRFGRFLSCSGFPDCKTTKPLMQRTGVGCPEDDGELVERQGRGGRGRGPRKFYGCTNYPDCTFTTSQRPLPQSCPDCDQLLVASGRDNSRCLTCDYRGPVPEQEEADDLAS